MKLSILVGLIVAAAAHPQTDNGVSSAQLKQLETRLTRTTRHQYLVQVPHEFQNQPQKSWSSLVFLHGGVSRGSNIDLVKQYGRPAVAEKKADFPFVLVSPQCPGGEIRSIQLLLNSARLDQLPGDARGTDHGRE